MVKKVHLCSLNLPKNKLQMAHLTASQRYAISTMLQNKSKQAQIAIALEIDKSVISRELKRNSNQKTGTYCANLAQRKYEKRIAEKPKKIKLTAEMRTIIVESLKELDSPEQIKGRAVLEKRDMVSHETIYQMIWADKKGHGKLYQCLRNKGRKYRKRGNKKDTRGIIKGRIDIDQRPEIVAQKTRLGDWEMDTMIGKDHKGALLTINDRVSSFVIICKLEGKDAKFLTEKAIESLKNAPIPVYTITSDNGKEFALHSQISLALNANFYFAKPYHSWERGANENTNGLIRQFFKKKTSFESITDQDVKRVQDNLNNRPRKKLGFLTPNEYICQNFNSLKVAFVA